MSKTNLEVWLRMVGFTENPFGMWEAGSEDRLPEYFIEPPYFDDVLGSASDPRTTIIAAERGFGKSANRLMIEYYCRGERVGGQILALPYTDFTRLVEHTSKGKIAPPIDVHIKEIVRQGLAPLFEWVREHPQVIEKVRPEHWGTLRWFLKCFDPFKSDDTDQQLRGLGIELEEIRARLRQAVLPTVGLDDVFYLDLLKKYMDIACVAGADAIYILVDGIDELGATAADAQACATLLEPLVSNLSIMEFPRVAFKFFLTPQVARIVKPLSTVRDDRLIFRQVEWSQTELENLLHTRLRALSNGRVSSLDELCAADLHGLDTLLVENAHGSPRNMLRLGLWVLSEHSRLPAEGNELLTRQDFDAALRRFSSELADRSFRIDLSTGEIYYHGKLIPFTPLEGKLFAFLLEKRGTTCSKDEIMESIYEAKDASALAALDQLLSRLRGTLHENESTRSITITSIRGRGLRLNLPAD